MANQADYSAELQEVVSFYGDDITEVDLTTQLEILSTRFAKEFQPDKPCTLKGIFHFYVIFLLVSIYSLSKAVYTFWEVP